MLNGNIDTAPTVSSFYGGDGCDDYDDDDVHAYGVFLRMSA